jgi:cytoskeleton-associated protein 5
MTAPKDIPDEVGGKNKGKKVDAYDLSEAVDVFKKFNEKWSESVINAAKWN